MKNNHKGERNQHSMGELYNIQGDSPKTIRTRNETNGIKATHHFFCYKLTQREVSALPLGCGGGTWLSLEYQSPRLPENLSFGIEIREGARHHVNKVGLAMARKEWEAAGASELFRECLRLEGYDVNTYTLPPEEITPVLPTIDRKA